MIRAARAAILAGGIISAFAHGILLMRYTRIAAMLPCAFPSLSGGCGQMGPLYMPMRGTRRRASRPQQAGRQPAET